MAAKAAALVLGRCQAGQTLQQAGPSRTLTLTLTLTLPLSLSLSLSLSPTLSLTRPRRA